MAITVNATEETITLKIAGNYFTWKPKAERVIHNEGICRAIEMDKKDSGICVLPELIAEGEDVSPEEFEQRKEDGKALREQLIEQALDRYIARKRELIYNNQVSLRRDLEIANIKVDPATMASAGELDAMRIVAKYQRRDEDLSQKKKDEVDQLMKKINQGK